METISIKKQEYINSLSGLKAICMLLIFWWHSSIPNPENVDLGARACEFLFVASGFLVGYNSFYKDIPGTWKESFRCLYKKIVDIWPLHFISMMLVMIFTVDNIFSVKNLINAVLNLSLLQVWSPYSDVRFSFNGPSWFLSVLFLCYFLSPMLLKVCKKPKISCIMFIVVFAVRYTAEYITHNFKGEFFNINCHTSPIIRTLEFFLGMLCVPLFMKAKSYMKGKNAVVNTLVTSVFEIAALGGCVYCSVNFNDVISRAMFVLIMIAVCFVFAFDRGILSRILSLKPFMWLSKIQLEIFLFHEVIIKCLNKPLMKYFPNWRPRSLILFVIVIICSVIYKKLLKKRLSGLLDKCLKRVIRIVKA